MVRRGRRRLAAGRSPRSASSRPARPRGPMDAAGLVLAPGFIDLLGQSEYNVLVDPRAASKITQGITTEVTGEGDSIAPLDEKALAENEDTYKKYGVRPDWKTLAGYFASLERRGIGDQPGDLRRVGQPARDGRRAREPPGDAAGACPDGGPRGPGDAGRRARRLLVAPVHPQHLLFDRGARPPWRRSRRSTAAPTSPTSARSPTASTRRSRKSSRSRARRRSAPRSGT